VPDAISLRGIEFLGVHGATEEERVRHQRFSVDLTLELPLEKPAKSDRVEDAVDYRELGGMVVRIGTTARYHLLEALASHIAREVAERWPNAAITVAIRKLTPPVDFAVQAIEVKIERGPQGAMKGKK
jgi:dihydroneopterin aldolase